MAARKKLADLDLSPRGRKLYTGNHPDAGGCSTMWCEPWHRPGASAAYAEAEAIVTAATKAELRAWLESIGASCCGLPKKSDLARYAHIRLNALWYPNVAATADDVAAWHADYQPGQAA